MKNMQKRDDVAYAEGEGPHGPSAVCLILPTGDDECLGAIFFVPASTRVAGNLTPVLAARELLTEEAILYENHSPAGVTLPPEA